MGKGMGNGNWEYTGTQGTRGWGMEQGELSIRNREDGWKRRKGRLGIEKMAGNGGGGIGNREDGWRMEKGELGMKKMSGSGEGRLGREKIVKNRKGRWGIE
jgi:hypothetical protein